MASSDGINYAIRPNKNIERKLVFEALAGLESAFPFSNYHYVGFGSFWFTDFILAHRRLGIQRMISIEYGGELAERARFNAPFNCIAVEEGDAASVLPSLPLDRHPAVIWLDYEVTIERVLDELARVCERAASGTVLLVTVNASKDRVEAADEAARQGKQEELFRKAVGELAPAQFANDFFFASKYPANVADALLRHLARATRVAGRAERFTPLFNFYYKDNAPMVTVGGMIANAVDQDRLRRAALPERFDFVRGDEQVSISVPPLTTREKLAFDKLLPRDAAPTQEEVSALGFRLKAAQIEAYHKYYQRYPIFGEFLP